MRLLIVHPQMALYGGAELVIARLVPYLEEYGDTVNIATLSYAPYPKLHITTPRSTIPYRIRSNNLTSLTDFPRMIMKLRSMIGSDYDIINPHNFPATWATPKDCNAIWMCNEVPDLWHNLGTSKIAAEIFKLAGYIDSKIVQQRISKIITGSSLSKEMIENRYHISPEVLHYGIDGAFFANYTANRDPDLILHAAMVTPSKDQMSVLRASKGKQVVFAGYNEPNSLYMKQLKEYIDQYNLKATFTGHITREELRRLYHTASVAVFAGKGQGSCLGPFEALAAGCPVIVSPNLPCADSIKEYSYVGDIAEGINNLVDPTKGQQYVLQELTWEKFATRYRRVLCSA